MKTKNFWMAATGLLAIGGVSACAPSLPPGHPSLSPGHDVTSNYSRSGQYGYAGRNPHDAFDNSHDPSVPTEHPYAPVSPHSSSGDYYDHATGSWNVIHRGEEVDFEMSDEILFGLNSADVSSRAYDIIQSVADVARRQPRSMVEVDGYTDTSGTYKHDMDLSQARAGHIADILAMQGVAKQRIIARGFGKSNLAVHTPDHVREPLNRRVVIRLLPPSSQSRF